MAGRMRIIGIDPGTNLLGFGVIDVVRGEPVLVDMDVLDLRKEADAYSKLQRICLEIGRVCDTYRPDVMALESPFLGKNAQVIFKLGRAQGAAIIAAVSRGIAVHEYAPRKAKVAITGNGSASKEQVANMVSRLLKVELNPSHLDATDAVAIALCHHLQLKNPLAGAKSSSSWEKFVADNPGRVK